jgi:glyoxylase-like metal-dependent hydrolase (beta-lactamase superfamily II)
MHIQSTATGAFQTNCYILANDRNECLIIDPGDGLDTLSHIVKEQKLKVIGYPTTHGHIDHVSCLSQIHKKFPAPIGLHPLDATWAFTPTNSMPPYYPTPGAPDKIERSYKHDQVWDDGGMSYRILFVPGHSPGSVGFYFEAEGVLIAGDTLFQGSIGRLDLPGGNEKDMIKSLRLLMTLPDDTRVLPGHGPETTIGQERRTNMFVLQYGVA